MISYSNVNIRTVMLQVKGGMYLPGTYNGTQLTTHNSKSISFSIALKLIGCKPNTVVRICGYCQLEGTVKLPQLLQLQHITT